MSAPYSDLQGKAEAAFKVVVQAALTAAGDTTTQVLTGLGSKTSITLPRIECYALIGDEFPHDTGNYWVTFKAVFQSQADPDASLSEADTDKIAQHRALVARAWDGVKTTTIVADLSAAVADFTVQGVQSWSQGGQYSENRKLVTENSFVALCSAADL